MAHVALGSTEHTRATVKDWLISFGLALWMEEFGVALTMVENIFLAITDWTPGTANAHFQPTESRCSRSEVQYEMYGTVLSPEVWALERNQMRRLKHPFQSSVL